MTSMLSVLEAAERVACHPATIRRMIQRGQIPAVRVGSRWRVPAESLQATYMAAAQPAPISPPVPQGHFARLARALPETGGRSGRA